MLFSTLLPLSILGVVFVTAQNPATTTADTLHGDHFCGVHRHRQIPKNPVARCVNIPLPPGINAAQNATNEDAAENDDPNADQRDCVACKACWNNCRQQRNMQELQDCRNRTETAMVASNPTCTKAMACFRDCRPKWENGQPRPTIKAHCFNTCCDEAALCVDQNKNNIMYKLLHNAWLEYNKECDVGQCRDKCSQECGVQTSGDDNDNEDETDEEETAV